MLLIEIIDKGFGPCPTNDNINSKGSFSELLFSFILEQYTICDICTMKSPAFETTSLLYVTPTDSSTMQELLKQEDKQKLYKTCSCCGTESPIQTTGLLRTKVACLWIYILNWVRTKFPTSFCGPSWILYEQWSFHSLNQMLWENISL